MEKEIEYISFSETNFDPSGWTHILDCRADPLHHWSVDSSDVKKIAVNRGFTKIAFVESKVYGKV